MGFSFFTLGVSVLLDRAFAWANDQVGSELGIMPLVSGVILWLVYAFWLLLSLVELLSYLLAHVGVVVLQMGCCFARFAANGVAAVAFLHATDWQRPSAGCKHGHGIVLRASFSLIMVLLIVGVVCGVTGDLSWLLLLACCSSSAAAVDDCRYRHRHRRGGGCSGCRLLPDVRNASDQLPLLNLFNGNFDDCVHVRNGWFYLTAPPPLLPEVIVALFTQDVDLDVDESEDMDWEPREKPVEPAIRTPH